MDSLNLAIVISPNLLKGSNPARDVAMVGVPGTPAFFDRPSTNDDDGSGKNPQATLGMVIALCIRRYYEVFDEEVVDPSEAAPSVSESPEQPMYVLSNEGEEEEEDDDKLQKRMSPPHVWVGACSGSSSPLPPPKRHKSSLSSGSNSEINSTTRSMHTVVGETNQYPTYSKAKSTISIENESGSTTTKGGSISIGRGTTRKGSGASVEAIGVTAGGFFSAPADDDAPLVPDGKGGWKKS